MLMALFITLHVIICVGMIFIVLIQTSKGGLDSTFGGVASNMMGAQGANDFVKNWTKILFAAFVISCILLAFIVKRSNSGSTSGSSVIGQDALTEEIVPPIDDVLTPMPTPETAPQTRTIQIGGDGDTSGPIQLQIGGDPEPLAE